MSESTPIPLLASTLEGGGQLVRLALSLSALTRLPISLTHIRANRSGGGGLKGQHLTCATWLARACNARVEGLELKSRELLFEPGHELHLQEGPPPPPPSTSRGTQDHDVFKINIHQPTPGAITLILQALLPYLLLTPSPYIALTITGGSNTSFAPSTDYLTHVLLPMLTLIGLPPMILHVPQRGWTHGAAQMGECTLLLQPLTPGTHLPAFTLTNRGRITHISATLLVPGAWTAEAQRGLDDAVRDAWPDIPLTEAHVEDSGASARWYLLLVAHSECGMRLGRDWLYDKRLAVLAKSGNSRSSNKKSRRDAHALNGPLIIRNLISTVIKALDAEMRHGGCVDEFLADQLVVFQALAKGRSCVDTGPGGDSLHARTAWWVGREMLGVRLEEGEEGDAAGCEGVGFVVGEDYGGSTRER